MGNVLINQSAHEEHIHPKDVRTSAAEKHFKVNVILIGSIKCSETNLYWEKHMYPIKNYGFFHWSSRTNFVVLILRKHPMKFRKVMILFIIDQKKVFNHR